MGVEPALAGAQAADSGPCGGLQATASVTSSQSSSASSSVQATAARRLRLPVSGDVLMTGGVSAGGKVLNSAQFYDVQLGKFVNTGPMIAPRAAHQAVMFPSQGEVLLVGGFSGTARIQKSGMLLSIVTRHDGETYDLSTGRFSALASQMMLTSTLFDDRSFFPAIVLNSGEGLFPGGLCNGNIRPTAQIYDPATKTFTLLPNDLADGSRSFETATLLGDGTVLIAGGMTDFAGDTTASAEIYDPSANAFTAVGAMHVARASHTATLLPNGTVLIAGGNTGTGGTLTAVSSAEVYDPSTRTFSLLTNGMNMPRAGQTATMLGNGTVLIAGGFNGAVSFRLTGNAEGDNGTIMITSGAVTNTAEIYNPSDNSFTCVGSTTAGVCKASMMFTRAGHTATLLGAGPHSGDVLIAGGFGGKKATKPPQPLKTVEFYDPASGQFLKAPSMNRPRAWQAAVTLQ